MGVVFERIGNDQTLSQVIEEKIEQAIRQKEYLPDEKLPTEKELCEMFGVSRTALREALQMLSSRGLIYIKKGSGAYVKNYSSYNVTRPMEIYLELNFDRNYLKHIIEVRKMLEPQIVRFAALNRTDDDIEKLRKNIAELENCSQDDFKNEGRIDRDFHLLIARASGNPMIPMIVEPIFQLMPKIKYLIYAEIEHAKHTAMEYHSLIFDNILKQDAEGAFLAMRDHLEIAEEHSKYISEKK